MADDEPIPSRLDSRTLDFTLRILLPGGVIVFLLSDFEPSLLATSSTTLAGVFAFLFLGFLSHTGYRALYRLASRFAPQMKEAKRIVDEIAGDENEGVHVRALYVEWRQENSDDRTLKYAARMAPYVHAGYQVSIIFASFFVAKSLGLFGGWDRDAQAVLAALAIVFAIASFFEDRELNSIERDFMNRKDNFRSYVSQTLNPRQAVMRVPQPNQSQKT